MKEEWRPVRGFEDYAEISNYGQIHYYGTGRGRYPDERFTYGSEDSRGYLYAGIGNKSFRVNRLVYLTFVGEIPDGLEVNHIDENKYNNRLDNLNLMTPKDNSNWGTRNKRVAAKLRGKPKSAEHKTKLSAAHKGKYNTKCSKAVQALDKVTGEVIYEFPSAQEAQRQGFIQSAVSACCNGNRKSHKGYIWRFKE